MSKTLVAICAYGGLKFLEMGLQALRAEEGFDILVIVAKPGDQEMVDRLRSLGIWHIEHQTNVGFAAAINDMYISAFVNGDYDNLIIMGNDVVPMPGTINAMIQTANSTVLGCFTKTLRRGLSPTRGRTFGI
jgi:GT2 family glycosyltransferase